MGVFSFSGNQKKYAEHSQKAKMEQCFSRSTLIKTLLYMRDANKNEKSDVESLNDPAYAWTTYDLGVSTALLCAGFELLEVEKSNPRKALFIFKKANGIEDVANRYFSDRLEVKARSFFDHFKALKNKLYSE